jgi:hypothetical protein
MRLRYGADQPVSSTAVTVPVFVVPNPREETIHRRCGS